MKKIIALAIMCLITVNVFAMEGNLFDEYPDVLGQVDDFPEELFTEDEPFLVRSDDLEYINGLPNNFTITSEELQEVSDVLPDAPQWGIDPTEKDINYRDFPMITKCSPKEYTCFRCIKKFYDSSKLREHERGYHNIKTYVCMNLVADNNKKSTICCKSFLMQDQLVRHRVMHTSFSCFYCKKSYISWEKLHEHIRQEHGINRSNPCLLCIPYTPFKTGSELYLHLREKHELLN